MKAMVLAAGFGTRLKPLTDDRPKALVKVAGRTLLETTLARLRKSGVDDVIVNVHHFADMVVEYLRTQNNFGMHIEVSREEVLLDTGGGLKKAGWFFRDDVGPFILHNVDVISTIDLRRMVDVHNEAQALATLAVKDRQTSRPLLFDDQLRLCGRPNEVVRPSAHLQALAFAGIHVISPRLLPLLSEEGAFSIIASYIRLAAEENVLGFRTDEAYWRDLGKPENLIQAEEDSKRFDF